LNIEGPSRAVLNSMPDWALLLVVVGFVLGVSLIGLFATRRFAAHWRTTADGGVTSAVAAMVMTLFALVLAFAVVTLYDQYNTATDSVAGEATDLAQIVRDTAAFPAPARTSIDAAIKAYVVEVRHHEFALMHDGKSDAKTVDLQQGIFSALQSFEPKTASQTAFYTSAITQLNDALTQRRTRLEAVNDALPDAFAILLVLTAAVSIFTTFFLSTENRGLEVILVSSVAIIVGAGLLTVLLLQYPFSGSVAVSSDPFTQGALAQLVGR
jgi:protein-S-isoprenylcysteine O-methyltransferase Ste14